MRRNIAGYKNRHNECYSDRTHHGFYSKSRKTICPQCAKIMRSQTGMCPVCKLRLVTISYRAKIPKKNAQFKQWKFFWRRHNEWCSKRPYFKDQFVEPNIDYRTGTMHVTVKYVKPVAVNEIKVEVKIDRNGDCLTTGLPIIDKQLNGGIKMDSLTRIN